LKFFIILDLDIFLVFVFHFNFDLVFVDLINLSAIWLFGVN